MVDPTPDTEQSITANRAVEKDLRDKLFLKAKMIARAYLERLVAENPNATMQEIAEDVQQRTGQEL